jgi:hypothetical protein
MIVGPKSSAQCRINQAKDNGGMLNGDLAGFFRVARLLWAPEREVLSFIPFLNIVATRLLRAEDFSRAWGKVRPDSILIWVATVLRGFRGDWSKWMQVAIAVLVGTRRLWNIVTLCPDSAGGAELPSSP